MQKIQRILPDPIRGQILMTDSLMTVTRPRQVVVHNIAKTFDIEAILNTDLMANIDFQGFLYSKYWYFTP
jgi:hypothetical protein